MNYPDIFIDIKTFDINEIIFLKPILFYKVSKNMGIYYKKNDKRQKIIFVTPKMIVPFSIKEFKNKNGKKAYYMCLSFTTMTNLYNENEINQFYQFIKKIDEVTKETINSHKKKWGLPKNIEYKKTIQRLSNDYPYYFQVCLPYDDIKSQFLFKIYNEEAQEDSLDIIKKRSIVSVILELTDIKFSDTEYKCNWTVMQIRKFKPYSPIQDFFMTGCYILDQDDPEDKAYAKLVENYHIKMIVPLSKDPNFIFKTPVKNFQPQLEEKSPIREEMVKSPPQDKKTRINIPEKSTHSIFKPPSLKELLTTKKNLRKTTTKVKIIKVGRVIDKVPPPPPPPETVIKKKKKKT